MSAFFSGPPSIFIQARWKRPKREYSALCAARFSTWEVRRASGKHTTTKSQACNGNDDLVRGHFARAGGACATGDWQRGEDFGSVRAEHEPGRSFASRNQIRSAQGQRADGRIEALARKGCDRPWPDRYRFGPDQRRHFRPTGDGCPVSVGRNNSAPTIWVSPSEVESRFRASQGKRVADPGANQIARAEPGGGTGAGASANNAGCGKSETATNAGRATS